MMTLTQKFTLSPHLLVFCALMACSTGFANASEKDAASYGNQGFAQHTAMAPHTLAGRDVSLQIEKVTSNLSSGFPNQGVIIKQYKNNGSWSSQGFGGQGHQTASGSYQYHRTGFNTAVDTSSGSQASTIQYTFDGAQSGKWQQSLQNGQIVLSGKFTATESNTPAAQQLAPDGIAGLSIALIIKSAVSTDLPPNSFPNRGLVLQTYGSDGKLVFQGFGQGTINSRGSYVYKKVSANTAVEETIQTSDFFTLPYTMVYTFKTSTSGVWYQNFGNGLIRFSGTFDTFPK